jgi:hypothetical protein
VYSCRDSWPILDEMSFRCCVGTRKCPRCTQAVRYWNWGGKNCSLLVQPPIFAIFSVVIILGERSSEHFLFLLARHFSPRYKVLKFRQMPLWTYGQRLPFMVTTHKPDFRRFCVMIALGKRSLKHVLFLSTRNYFLRKPKNVKYHMLT